MTLDRLELFLLICFLHWSNGTETTGNEKNQSFTEGNERIPQSGPSKSAGTRKTGEEVNRHAPFHKIPPPSSLFQTQPTKFRQDFSTLPVVVNADRVSRILRKLANEDMGVYSMQAILDGMTYRSEPFDHADGLRKMADTVDSRLEDARKAVYEIRLAVLALFAKAPIDMHLFKQFRECCTLDEHLLLFSSRYSCRINSSFTCDVLPHKRLSAFSFYPGKNLGPVFARNAERYAGIRWQYFMTTDGVHTEFPAHHFDDHQNFSRCLLKAKQRRWNGFVAAALPFFKSVIVIIDHGSGVSHAQLETGKCIARSVINALNEKDRVTVLAISNTVVHPSRCDQYRHLAFFPFASRPMKTRLSHFINSLTRDTQRANHTLAFQSAFDIYAQLFAEFSSVGAIRDIYPSIIYISRGLLTEITEAKHVLATIMNGIHRVDQAVKNDARRGHAGLVNSIQINTVALMEPGKLVMWETQFLQDVANKNFSKHKLVLPLDADQRTSNLADADWLDPGQSPPGKMIMVNATPNVEAACIPLSDLLSLLERSDYDRRMVSLGVAGSGLPETRVVLSSEPYEPVFVSSVVAVRFDGRLLGVAGVDIMLSDLISPAIYYTSSDTSAYAAVTDVNGLILYHPKLRLEDDIVRFGLSGPATLTFLEDWPKERGQVARSLELEEAIRNQWYGFYDMEFDSPDNATKSDRNYFWHKTSNHFLTFIISTSESSAKQKGRGARYESKVYVQHALSYHRLDFSLNKDVRLCYHGKSLASYERAGVFLSPRAFDRPYDRRFVPETKQSAQGYWAYTTDDTRLITNPGLKHGIRHEVGAFSKIAYEWKKQEEKSGYRLAIVRRYLAMPSGILLTYPATVVNQNYDPLMTDWYRSALQNPGRVVLSRSFLDPHGFGNLVTLSHTVYEGKAAMHRPGDAVAAVMAIDVPLTFLYKLLFDSLSVCREQGMDCFLFNEYGYVVANRHAFAVDDETATVIPDSSGQMQSHRSQQTEPSVASEILQRKEFAVKMICTRVGDETLQRFYLFNTSFADVLRSTDGCLRYQIAVVPQTNVFLAVVNRSCHRHSSFCPCSVNDRRCLNCHRGIAEPSESWCECPCECPQNPFNEDVWCPREVNDVHLDSAKTCSPTPLPERPVQLDSQFLSTAGNNLPVCMSIHCGEFSSENICRGVMGCEWCSYGSDGYTSLKSPYCAPLNSCFGGVQGLVAYSEGDVTYDPIAVPTPVGPVAGGIMGIFVLLVAGVYWYRHHVVRLVERRHGRYGSGGSASCLQRFDDSVEEGYHFDDGSGGMSNGGGDDKGHLAGGNALLLASFERQNLGAGQAPRPRYRPGPRTESSDPGYSTMTGNCDDSEQATTVDLAGRIGGRIALRFPAFLGHKSFNAALPFCRPTVGTEKGNQVKISPTVTVVDPPLVPGATVLPQGLHCGPPDGDTANDVPLPQNSPDVPGATNIVTMALIHHQPALAET